MASLRALMASLWVLMLLGVVAAERHYLFTAPKAFIAGGSEKMCITLFNVPETGDLTLTFKESMYLHGHPPLGQHSQTVAGVAGGSKQTCFDVKIPDSARWNHVLDLAVTFPPEANYSIRNHRPVTIDAGRSSEPEEYLFVQTDKYVYKPGQLVRFRVFSVDSNLRPISKPFPLIHIETPLGTRADEWTDETVQHGLAQLELQLSDEPPLGEWNIHVQTSSNKKQKKTFKVEEYVLPKFEVEVRGPPYILADAEEVIWRVCGKDTYGKPVQGDATVHISSSPHLMRNVLAQHQKTRGDDCARFRISAATLGLEDINVNMSRIDVRAELTEEGTDVTHGATKGYIFTNKKLELTTGNLYDKYFKPGLPFIDRITILHPDHTPATGELVQLCYTIERNATETPFRRRHPVGFHRIPTELNTCLNLTSDSAGIVAFYVPPQDQEVQEITVKATLPLAASTHRRMHPLKLSYRIKGWYSESGAFLQLSRKDGVKFSCGTSADIPILFTASLGSQLELFYQVMGRGDILLSESVPVAFDESADLPAAGLDGATAIGSPSAEAGPTGLVTLSIPVTPSMSSGFKVLVYMVVAGEVIADSQLYEAVPCLDNPVTLRWSPDRARPQQQVQLTVGAAPGSLCGLDVVDKSEHLLGTKNKISLSHFFDRLKQLNLNKWSGIRQVSHDSKYCTAKYGDPNQYHGAVDESTSRSRFGSFSPRRRTNPTKYSWKVTHVDSLTAFDKRSFLLLSDYVTEARTCVAADIPASRRQNLFGDLFPGLGDEWSIGQAVIALEKASGVRERDHPESTIEAPDTVRTYFPETWLFDLHTVGEDGTVTLNQEVPDTITEWVGGAVCTSDTAGLGIAASAALTSF